jgi:hypothetical protein
MPVKISLTRKKKRKDQNKKGVLGISLQNFFSVQSSKIINQKVRRTTVVLLMFSESSLPRIGRHKEKCKLCSSPILINNININ